MTKTGGQRLKNVVEVLNLDDVRFPFPEKKWQKIGRRHRASARNPHLRKNFHLNKNFDALHPAARNVKCLASVGWRELANFQNVGKTVENLANGKAVFEDAARQAI